MQTKFLFISTLTTLFLCGVLNFPSDVNFNSITPAKTGVKGHIYDDSNSAVPFVNVVFIPKSGQNKLGAITDLNGYYEITNIPPGEYLVTATMVGYKPESKKIMVEMDVMKTLNITLGSAEVKLEEVEVVEYSIPLINEDESISIMSISKEASRKASGKISKSKNCDMTSPAYNMSNNFGSGGFVNQQIHNTESYDAIFENQFRLPKDEPLSTFSIDVDAASYSNMRRFINNGQLPPKDAVRIEEMINYFSYDYPQPEDENPFSITTEMSDCPWNNDHKLVHIGLQGKKIDLEEMAPANLVFLIDVSGSMSNANKLPLLKQSFQLLVNQLRPQDKVAICVYAGAAGCVLPSTSGANKTAIKEALNQLQSGGSTAGGAGIKLAYKIAQENFAEEGNNRVILATDGDFNIGASSDAEMIRLIEDKRESGVFLTVLGFGMGNYKDSKMEKIADHGNGNYAYVDNIMEAKKVFVNELGSTLFTIAKDVKIQVEFNPSQVASYKLIGYENRLLNKEDFNDDKKDAGELGAGHTVTALYEIALKGMYDEPSKIDPLRYGKRETKEIETNDGDYSSELMTVKLRYKTPEGSKSKLITRHLENTVVPLELASDNFIFSACVAEFGLLIRDSKFKGSASYKNVEKMGQKAKGVDSFGYRSEFLRLVQMSQLLASK